MIIGINCKNVFSSKLSIIGNIKISKNAFLFHIFFIFLCYFFHRLFFFRYFEDFPRKLFSIFSKFVIFLNREATIYGFQEGIYEVFF